MMTIEQMKARKEDLMYTYEMIAERSGLPLSTVQKVLCGVTRKPRRATMEALEMALKKPSIYYDPDSDAYEYSVREDSLAYKYTAVSSKVRISREDYWTVPEPSDKWPKQGEYTFADLEALPDDVRVELIDGYIYDMAPPSVRHQRILGLLFAELRKCIDEHEQPCEVFMAPSGFFPDEGDESFLESDIQVRCREGRTDDGEAIVGTGLVVEILSPSTRIRDCMVKLFKYMHSEVREYWIVDPEKERVTVYVFDEDPLPVQYSFDDVIPISISDGRCSIDFGDISRRLREASELLGDRWKKR